MIRSAARDVRPETTRQVGDLLRVGFVESVDLAAGKAVVSFGEQTTPPIDWLMVVGDTTVWIPPTPGQQVLVLTPEGDVDQAVVLNGLPSSAFAPLFLGLRNAVRFADGAQVSYDPEAGALDVQTPGSMTISAAGGVTITADARIVGKVEIEGDVAVTGKLDATGDIGTPQTVRGGADVVFDGKSAKAHRHPAGSPNTGTPL